MGWQRCRASRTPSPRPAGCLLPPPWEYGGGCRWPVHRNWNPDRYSSRRVAQVCSLNRFFCRVFVHRLFGWHALHAGTRLLAVKQTNRHSMFFLQPIPPSINTGSGAENPSVYRNVCCEINREADKMKSTTGQVGENVTSATGHDHKHNASPLQKRPPKQAYFVRTGLEWKLAILNPRRRRVDMNPIFQYACFRFPDNSAHKFTATLLATR